MKEPLVPTLLLACAPLVSAQQSIVDSKHNLSVSGPGPFKATTESRICIFCHTPHRSRTDAPLWNRSDSRQSYLAYDSSTFQGSSGQPSGSSKLCLSCHDGSIALGSVLSSASEIEMQPGHRHLASGPAFLGTNLMDDHPVSFDYAQSALGGEYHPPGSITAPVHLDPDGRVQCTSCHEPHDNTLGNFLLASDRNSALCASCHDREGWLQCAHNLSQASWDGTGTNPWPRANHGTVGENGCTNCHTVHGAGHPERLLTFPLEEDNCIHCHNGNVASKDVTAELSKPFRHNPFVTSGVHDPTEDPLAMTRHVECVDCHNPHQVRPSQGGDVPGPLTGIDGINGAGQRVQRISFLYELCYKCHADSHGSPTYVPRQIQQANTRLEFDPGNPSYHPIEAPGKNPDVPSLLPPWTEASTVKCTDCHQSDTSPDEGGSGLRGPHGSVHEPLLVRNYDRTDNIPESPTAYALCYGCHSRASILGDDSFDEHRMHIVEERSPCSACHDAHGISSSQGNATNNTHLINFNVSIVQPNNGVLRFQDEGFRRGNCTLICHGEDHDNENY